METSPDAIMVFEGVLATVINRFLGAYVKNLDASQLNVGIWSGMYVCSHG